MGLAAVAAIAAAVVIIASGGGEEGNRAGASDASVKSTPGDAETCVDRWNSGASDNARNLVGTYARNFRTGEDTPTYVSAGFSADVPDRCLITVAQPDIGRGVAYQYTETADGSFDFPSGSSLPLAALPTSVKQWNANGDRDGNITLGAP